jgi:hypothetical protein
MVSSYYGLNIQFEKIQELVVAETSGATWTLGLAAAAAEIGLAVRMYSRSLGVNQSNFALEYYRENAAGLSEAQQKLVSLGRRCTEHGGVLEERGLSFEELCSAVRARSVPILLLDWAKVINHPAYIGHFLPMVGFTDSQVLLHNPGPLNPMAFMPLDREIFEIARKALGTDEDVLIIDGLRG